MVSFCAMASLLGGGKKLIGKLSNSMCNDLIAKVLSPFSLISAAALEACFLTGILVFFVKISAVADFKPLIS